MKKIFKKLKKQKKIFKNFGIFIFVLFFVSGLFLNADKVFARPGDPEPVVTLSANPTTVSYGGSSTLSWTAPLSASYCYLSNGETGENQWTIPGSVTYNIYVTTTWYITCYNEVSLSVGSANATTTIGTAPTGWIMNQVSCEIPVGQSACSADIQWGTDNPIGTSTLSSTVTTTIYANSGYQSFTIPYNSASFTLANNGSTLASATTTSYCASGSSWNGSLCASSNATYYFDGNGATTNASPTSVTQAIGSSIATPTSPSRTGYTFNGWSPAIPSTMPSGGGTSYAQWVDNIAPSTPGNISVSWSGDHYINTSFSVSTSGSTDSGSGIRGYRLCRSNNNAGGCSVWTASGEHAGLSETVSGSDLPSAGTFRYYYWYAYDNAGNQSGTSGDYIRMDGAGPTTPGAMTTSWVGDHYVNTNFTAATSGSTDAGIGVSYYNLCRSADNSSGCNTMVATGVGTSTTVSGANLPSNGAYRYYYWYAYDGFGNQSGESTGTYVRMETTAPSISDISATNATTGSTVRFYVSASDSGVGLNTGNAAFYLGTYPYSSWNRVNGGTMTWNGSQYYYDVILNDSAGTTYRAYTYVYDSLGNQGARDENPTEFTISKATPTVLTITSTSGTYPSTVALTTSGGASNSSTPSFVVNSGPCTVSGSTLTPTGAGTCMVTATKATDTNWLAVSSTSTAITIGKATPTALTITSTSGTYPSTVALTTSGGASNSSTPSFVVNSGPCTVSGSTLTPTGAGTCMVTATKATDTNWLAISSSSSAITIGKATQPTVTLGSQTVIYTPAGNNFTTLVAADGLGAGAYSYNVTSAGAGCAVGLTTGVLTYTSAGTCGITATKAADANYLVASSAQTTFTINKATPTATLAVSNSPAIYDGTAKSATVSVSVSSVSGSVTSILTGVSATQTNAGTYAVTATFTPTDQTNYNSLPGIAAGNFVINKANQSPLSAGTTTAGWDSSITVSAIGGTTGGTKNFYVAAGGTASGCSIVPLTGILTATSAGTCNVYATMAGDTNYNLVTSATIQTTFTKAAQPAVTVTAQTITSPALFTALTATGGGGTGGYIFTLASAGTAGCSVLGTTLSYIGAGTCTVTAVRDTDTNYLVSAASVAQTFSVSVPKTYNLSGYRLFNNANSFDVGNYISQLNTSARLNNSGDAFRFRILIHVGGSLLPINGENFKLQFSPKSGTCDASFVGENYVDVTKDTNIAFYKNFNSSDGSILINNASDPTHNEDIIVNQSYVESNNFTNLIAPILVGQDGKWDFSLYDKGVSSNASYCLRVVKSDGNLLDTYSVIPEIATSVYYSRGGGGHVESVATPDTIKTGGGQGGGNGGGDTILPQCSDDKDNDADGVKDINDPQCHVNGQIGGEYRPLWDSETVAPIVNTGGGQGGGGGDLGFFNKIKSIFTSPFLKNLLLAMAYNPF